MDDGPLLLPGHTLVNKPTHGVPVLYELVAGELTEPEIFPPGRLFLSAVPFQHLGEKPACPVADRGRVTGNKSQEHGYVVNTWANGDKSFVRTQGSAAMKGETIESADGTWSFTGGPAS
jgi:hypothetical protein